MTHQPSPRDLVAALATRTTQLGITRRALATTLGVTLCAVNAWYRGAWMPSFAHTAAWADHVGLRLAVVLDGQVFSEGAGIPGDLLQLRHHRGLLQKNVAALARTRREVIWAREHRLRDPDLALVHDHVTLLGYRLTLLINREHEAVAG